MIRKQIYLDDRHQESVRRMAAARGVSEAEVIREAIDAQKRQPMVGYQDPAAWKRALAMMRSQRVPSGKAPIQQTKWTREELYEDRLKRYGRRPR
jgi:pyrroloquinoline quinone (PQQ) biosynthesis protein C